MKIKCTALLMDLIVTYNFNPHRHVKIWLSKDKDIFLNLENRVRLVKMRVINPNDEINLIYDSNLLSVNALKELDIFCTKYNIVAKDIQKDIIPRCETIEEKNLIEIYNDELLHLETGGNLIVGSSVLRWLKPVYELGTYTDFYVSVDTRTLPDTLSVKAPLLLNVGSFDVTEDVEFVNANSDILTVADNQAALPYIQKIQKAIYANCSRQPHQAQHYMERYQKQLRNRISEILPPSMAQFFLSQGPIAQNLEQIDGLADLGKEKTAREARNQIINDTANNLILAKNILTSYLRLSDLEIIKAAANWQRAIMKQKLGWIGWFFLTAKQYKHIETIVSIRDDHEFLTKIRESTRMGLLFHNVAYTTGSIALSNILFDNLLHKKDIVKKKIEPLSFARYGLDKAFLSENGLTLHGSIKTAATKLGVLEPGVGSDLSWLQEGQAATVLREQKIIEAQEHMPQNVHDMREKIEIHIKKIQGDLSSCFGFYRYKERHAKIHALQNILRHFEADSFDVDGYNAALDSYRTKDVFASIGKSKTKELIDKLDFLGQCAKYYMLTNEHGKIELSSCVKKLSL